MIFIDDYYNPNWPGVQEGICKLFITDSPRFVPLIATCNKLILCHISYHAEYLDHVEGYIRANFTGNPRETSQAFRLQHADSGAELSDRPIPQLLIVHDNAKLKAGPGSRSLAFEQTHSLCSLTTTLMATFDATPSLCGL